MTDWSELMKNKVFITDLGKNQTAVIGEKEVAVGRYAVWSPSKNSRNHLIIEVGDNLETLQKKYSVPDNRVCRLA